MVVCLLVTSKFVLKLCAVLRARLHFGKLQNAQTNLLEFELVEGKRQHLQQLVELRPDLHEMGLLSLRHVQKFLQQKSAQLKQAEEESRHVTERVPVYLLV